MLFVPLFLIAQLASAIDMGFMQVDTTEKDTTEIELPYPFKDNSGEGLNGEDQDGGLYLEKPSNIKGEFIYDPETDSYIYVQKIGDRYYRNPEFMTLEEYRNYDMKNADREYFREKSKEEDIGDGSSFRPKLYVENKTFDRIFGGNTIDIRPQGSAEISFGINTTRRDNPAIPENQRRTTNFDFDEKIQLNVVGSVGDKLKISTSYNTEATFDFENQTKIEYSGYEDEIIQKIELGNVALPLQGSLIQGSQTLFGIKTELKFGRLRVTSILSQEKGERKEVNTQGGSQTQEFELSASDYEDNQHYFLGHYFRDRYNQALSDLPNVVSNFRVNKVDVWVTQVGGQIQNSRNVIAFTDLGESQSYQLSSQDPSYQNLINPVNTVKIADNHRSNDLYAILTDSTRTFPIGEIEQQALRSFTGVQANGQNITALNILTGPLGMINGKDFEAYEAVLLNSSEYSVNEQLGYISLNRQMKPEDILSVAYEYIINDNSYQVGEISNQVGSNQTAIYTKLLKSSFTNTSVPMWDLMMKNVYYLNSFGISKEDFRFEIWYLDQEAGVSLPFIADGPINKELLLQVMELDNLDYYNAKHEDGEFDYIENVTIRASKGRVYFPVVEPFGAHLREKLGTKELGDKYAYDSLYSTTKALAELEATKNRFTIKGSYKSSSSSEIRLNAFNIPQGSVVVTAGGVRLQEGSDYIVDYNLGTVKILNQGYLESNTPIKVSLESNSLFNIQTKTLLGSRFDYDVSQDLKLGGTVLNLTERPLTNKVNIGDEAISNTIMGLDGSYSTDAPILTKIADALPFYDTKEKSKVNTTAEFAYLLPGNARAITKEGVAYIDDFEGSQSQIDMKSVFTWRLASTPQGQSDLWPEASSSKDSITYGFNRAKLSWYVIDPLFFSDNDDRLPGNITTEMQENHYMRQVLQREIFPNKSLDQTLIGNIPVLDLTYYPEERGPYNFDVPQGVSGLSRGIDPNTGNLRDPETRWGGIMRDIQTVDFSESNIEFLQFWVMDPFMDNEYEKVFDQNPGNGGNLYLHFGEVSEDILKDGRKSYENGFPFSGNDQPIDQTIWGSVPVNKSIVNAFDNLPEARPDQDVGLDGLRTNAGGYQEENEQSYHFDYLDQIQSHLADPEIFQEKFSNDPAADDFKYFRDDGDSRNQNIVERYKDYNGLEGNSPVNTGDFVASSTTIPDIEDVNRDNTMNTKEAYFQYKIPINRNVFSENPVGQNYVTDMVTREVNGKEVRWFQFKIPLSEPDKVVGQISDFKSIRFMRMIMKDFDAPVIMRFAKLDLIRGEWRRYTGDLRDDGQYIQGEDDDTQFEVNAVNIEENSSRQPIHYVLPPGIERETDYGTANLQQLNEQALSLNACYLNDGDVKAAYRNLSLDIRQYKRLKMYVHLEDGNSEQNLNDPLERGEISLILRMGQDFNDNYYEYEIPLTPSEWGVHSREAVWPSANNIDVELKEFTEVKLNRDASGFSRTQVYSEAHGVKTIRVKGSPNIANVKTLMVGVKNPKRNNSDEFPEDNKPKCATVWVNELRVSDFDNKNGWATTASVRANMADLASFTLSGSMSTPGFGSIDQKINERQQETKQAYDFTSNFELGKFTSDAVSIPMFFGYSESWDKPRYVPLNPDIELEDIENSDKFTQHEKDSILKSAIKYRNRKSLNFTNVKVNYGKGSDKKHFYDVQNWSFTYAYDKDMYRDVNLEFQNKTNQRGRILFAYSAKPKNHQPFSKAKWAKSKYLRLIKDFNYTLLPSQYSFSTTINRGYQEKKLRQTNPYYDPRPYYQKSFNWDRDYALQWNLTRGLKFRYDAKNSARIDEPEGVVDRSDTSYARWKETVMKSIREFGTNLNFAQNFTVDYDVPINKIPLTDWLNFRTSYNASFNWDRAAIGSEQYGNTIRNTGALRYQSSWNLTNLYNKIDYLNRLNQTGRGRYKNKIRRSRKKEKELKEEKRLEKMEQAKNKNSLKNKDEEEEKKNKKKDEDEKYRELQVHDYFFKILTGIKDVSGQYTKSTGTVMPGYQPTNSLLGFDQSWNAPGAPFILGRKQDTNYVMNAETNNWLVTGNEEYRYNFTNNDGVNYSYRINIRPINNMRIELNGNYNYSIGTVMGYTWVDTLRDVDGNDIDRNYNKYLFDNAIQTGSFSISTLTYKTAFVPDDRSSYNSETFDKFNELRYEASAKLAADRALSDTDYRPFKNDDGYYNEYGPTQQDVLISSFLAAYSGKDAVDIGVRNFKDMFPLPNWRVTYDGLGKIKFLSKWFQSIVLNHSYRSTFNVSNFTTNNQLTVSSDSVVTTDVATGNFVPKYQITQVSIVEMFSPFMDIDFNFRNGLFLGFEYRRDRNISLSTVNNQITEVKGREYIVGVGYTFRDIKVTLRRNSKSIPKDIITRLDVSSRDNYTLLRNIGDEVASQPGNGQNVLSLKLTADLAINPKFNIRGFYDRIVTNPFISNSFPTASSNFGVSLRFSLAQ